MDYNETLKIMAVLKAAYPNYYKDMKKHDAENVVALWQEMFSAEEYPVVAAAVKALIATKADGFPPTIGAVKTSVDKLTHPQDMTEAEAWELVATAVRKTDWQHPEKQFEKLPEEIQRTLGSANTLVEYGKTDENQFATVVASNFMRSYRARSASIKEFRQLPPDVQLLAKNLADTLGISGNKPKQIGGVTNGAKLS